ncbi:MAG: damage-inducible protein CinA [Planctomycetaceae bacterium]|nr:damage-inducible protein CinA [Planctomycetaceae bacterium]
MHAEIIAIGSELTTGAKLDTNSQWLSLELAEIGIPVRFHSTVADDHAAMLELFRGAADRSDIVLITGGLGPTLDDLTRQLLADLLGTELVLHEPSLAYIKELFEKRGRYMPERNVIQAKFPEGSEPIENPVGTAPGIWLEYPREGREPSRVAAMPGVPSEMRRMYANQVLPRLPQGDKVIMKARVNCFGIGESAAEEKLGDLTARGREPEVGITVHEATITLRITAHGNSREECQVAIDETKELIRERMEGFVFGEEDEGLEHILMRSLVAQEKTIAVAECGSGGVLARSLSSVNENDLFRGGLVLSESGMASDPLSIPAELIDEHGVISRAAAKFAAEQIRELFHVDYALFVSAFRPLDHDEEGKPIPNAYVAAASDEHTYVQDHVLVGDPQIARSRAAKTIMDLMRRKLL